MALIVGDLACTTGVASSIYTALMAVDIGGVDSTGGNAKLKALAYAIADAVVTSIQDNAEVLPSSLVAPPGGGPVTGTGTIL